MSVESILLLTAIAASALLVCVYIRHSKRQQILRLRRLENRLNEISALIMLQEPAFSLPLPWTSWTLSAGCLLRVRESFAKRRISTVVECGAGISTLHVGRFLAENGGRLVSLEDDETWAKTVQRLVQEEGLEGTVSVLHRPMVEHRILEHTVRWYDVSSPQEMGLESVDLILVDGPPGVSGPLARLAALPILWPALKAGAELFLDDAQRPDEERVLRLWQDSYPISVDVMGGARPYAHVVISSHPE